MATSEWTIKVIDDLVGPRVGQALQSLQSLAHASRTSNGQAGTVRSVLGETLRQGSVASAVSGVNTVSSKAEEARVLGLDDVVGKGVEALREVMANPARDGKHTPESMVLDVLEGSLRLAGKLQEPPKAGEEPGFDGVGTGLKGVEALREVLANPARDGKHTPQSVGLDVLEGSLRLAGKLRGEPQEGEDRGFDVIGSGLKVVDAVRESIKPVATASDAPAATQADSTSRASSAEAQGQAATASPARIVEARAAGAGGVQRVFVVNLEALRDGQRVGTRGTPGGARAARGRGRGGRRRTASASPSRSTASRSAPAPATPPAPAPADDAPRVGRLARVAEVAGKAGRFVSKHLPWTKLLEAGGQAIEVLASDKSDADKAEGVGGVAGGLAGGLAGAAAGAAIGSVVPIIGTALGGVIGGILGSEGGDVLGGKLGRRLFVGNREETAAQANDAPLMLPRAARPAQTLEALSHDVSLTQQRAQLEQAVQLKSLFQAADAGAVGTPSSTTAVGQPGAAAPLNQQISMPITVQGDVRDPQELIRQLQPFIQQVMAQINQSTGDRQLFDAPHL